MAWSSPRSNIRGARPLKTSRKDPPPTAVGSTAAQNVVAGSTANFLFSPAFATSPSFQWRSIIGGVTNKLTDGGNIAGATTTGAVVAR